MPRKKSSWENNPPNTPLRRGQQIKLIEGIGTITDVGECGATVAVAGSSFRIARCSTIPVGVLRDRRGHIIRNIIINKEKNSNA